MNSRSPSFFSVSSGLAPQWIAAFAAFPFPVLVRQKTFRFEPFYLPEYLPDQGQGLQGAADSNLSAHVFPKQQGIPLPSGRCIGFDISFSPQRMGHGPTAITFPRRTDRSVKSLRLRFRRTARRTFSTYQSRSASS